jgi:hypothetical protein
MSFRDGNRAADGVLTSDGTVLGKVGSVEGDAIALTQAGSPVRRMRASPSAWSGGSIGTSTSPPRAPAWPRH